MNFLCGVAPICCMLLRRTPSQSGERFYYTILYYTISAEQRTCSCCGGPNENLLQKDTVNIKALGLILAGIHAVDAGLRTSFQLLKRQIHSSVVCTGVPYR